MARLLPTLSRQDSRLASPARQLALLASVPAARSFPAALAAAGLPPLDATGVDVLQVNLGKRCNQTCRHCHVDAGPDRREVMAPEVIDACLTLLERHHIPVFDITGGAPELHPDFRAIVARAAATGAHVMHRCNLTAILLPNYADIPALLAHHRVEIVASLPYFQARETDAQRGDGVFEQSIEALRRLNALGYGQGGVHRLTLVTNPVGTFLPSDQAALETRWKQELRRRVGVEFDRLHTITNMPIARFLEFLEERGRTADYLTMLARAFNPDAAASVMCRTTLSVGYDGRLHDCDFNQMLELGTVGAAPRTIAEALQPGGFEGLRRRRIAVASHCFGCTAGAGSSCGGAVTAAGGA